MLVQPHQYNPPERKASEIDKCAGPLPPPWVMLICQCNILVTEFTAYYQGIKRYKSYETIKTDIADAAENRT
jgi:hypothetical protein